MENKKRNWKEIVKKFFYWLTPLSVFFLFIYLAWHNSLNFNENKNWLEINYPINGESIDYNESHGYDNRGKKRSEVEIIEIYSESEDYKIIASDKIDFTNFDNLEEFSACAITQMFTNEIDLSACNELRKIWLFCKNNSIDKIIFPTDNKISVMVINNNRLKIFNYQSLNPKTLIILNLNKFIL